MGSNNNNMKNLTNKKLNQLTIIASALPKFQLKNADGTKMFHSAQKVIAGKELTKDYIKKLGDEYNPNINYIIKYSEPTLMNHKQNLIDAYQKHGDIGVEDYVRSAKKFETENKIIPKTMGVIAKTKRNFLQFLSAFKLNFKPL